MSNELTDVRCSCGDEYPADSYDAGFIAGSGMCQNCDAALTPKDICTCPSGDGSLRHPCPAHIGPFDKLVGSPVHNESEPDLPPLDEHLAQVFETGMALSESVEQAGGDERDLQAEGAQGELLPCPFCGGQAHLTYDDYVHDDLRPMPVVECNACHTWVRAESWNKRAALAQPSPTTDSRPAEWSSYDPTWVVDFIRDNSIFNADLIERMLEYATRPAGDVPQAEQAEAERPEGPTEDELEAAGLGYPLHKEEAVKLWYSGFRSEVITVLEAWEACLAGSLSHARQPCSPGPSESRRSSDGKRSRQVAIHELARTARTLAA
ncbi:TPA: Lar family restriction alleviation protein [Pseudomonas aeruginosa]|nr:Lar family restriction alleviation protein [Pseudomonas aeruginosa]